MIAALLLSLLAAPSSCPATASFHAPGECHYVVTDAGVDPDPNCTPGEFDPSLTWQVLCAEKQTRRCADNPAVGLEYGVTEVAIVVNTKTKKKEKKIIPVDPDAPHGEDDHDIPLCAGGTNNSANRWQQPAPDFKHKDVVEAAACRALCKPEVACAAECPDDDKACLDKCPRALSLEAARAMIANWRAAYRQLKGVP